MTAAHIADLARGASPEALALARAVLETDVADRAWAAQIGPALTQRDVARLLAKSEQAVSKDGNLLRVVSRSGRPVYPVVQFEGRKVHPSLPDVLSLLRGVLAPLTIASWLTAANPALGGRRPIDALTADRDAVLDVARRLAASAA